MRFSFPPKINFNSFRGTLLYTLIGIFLFVGGYVFGFYGYYVNLSKPPNAIVSRENPETKKDVDFALFWEVWDTLGEKYFDRDKVIPANMVYGAISGMVSSIGDPYTVFLPPQTNKVFQEDLKGSFDGVGIQIGFRDGQLAVISPLPSSPAERGGILAGDYIMKIKDAREDVDVNTQGISVDRAVQLIRGPKGTVVTLTIYREGMEEPFDVDLIRDNIDVPSVELKYVGEGGKIAHIKVIKFSAETKQEWEKAVIDILKRPEVDGIIVDVRNNPGGYLYGAVDLATEFVEIGNIVVVEERGKQRTEFKVENLGKLKSKNIVVLINKGSASASEIFAGAMRDLKKTVLIGETTFGKGTIQEPIQVDGGAGLNITIARWLTPSGYWVNDGGLVPDIEVVNDRDTEIDEQLEEAIGVLENI
jgi:carboxyl-terminal processing protease